MGYLHRLTSRFFLNLRNIVYHQQQATVGTRAAIPAVAAPRTNPTWNQSGRPTTNFIIDMSIDRITHNSETDTSKGDIQQAEVFHLEALRSRNWHHGEKDDSGIKNDVERQ